MLLTLSMQLETHVSVSILHALGIRASAGERILITSDPLNMALVRNGSERASAARKMMLSC